MNEQRPTPETDAEWDRLQRLPCGGYSSRPAGIHLAGGLARWAANLERQRDEAREEIKRAVRHRDEAWDEIAELKSHRDLARELMDALVRLADHGHTDDCIFLNLADGGCDCGVDAADALAAKAKEVLG